MVGHQHVYFVQADGIYRVNRSDSKKEKKKCHRRHPPDGGTKIDKLTQNKLFLSIPGEFKSEQVLNLELLPVQETELEQRRQWAVQRMRLSPQEEHLAATVKSLDCTEPR